jgi:hypothetical protein
MCLLRGTNWAFISQKTTFFSIAKFKDKCNTKFLHEYFWKIYSFKIVYGELLLIFAINIYCTKWPPLWSAGLCLATFSFHLLRIT